MKSVGWALINYDRCIIRRGNQDTSTSRDVHVKIQGVDGHVQAIQGGRHSEKLTQLIP